MKYAFLCFVIVLIGCSPADQKEADSKEKIPDPTATMWFEGKEFVKVDVITYQREEDEYLTILTLFPDGKVQSVEHQGEFQSCGALVDTSRYFNESGVLIKQVFHDHWMPEGGEGCHESIQDLHVTEYFENGSIMSKRVFQMAYQGEENKAGIWEEFDENGKVISTINYGDPSSIEDLLSIDFIEKLEHVSPYIISQLMKRGFVEVSRSSSEEDRFEFYNEKSDNRIKLSKTRYPDGEISFVLEYYVNRNQLIAFEDPLKEANGPYVYHGSSADAYIKDGLGTYESKRVKIVTEENKISYSHLVGKELSVPPPIFERIPRVE